MKKLNTQVILLVVLGLAVVGGAAFYFLKPKGKVVDGRATHPTPGVQAKINEIYASPDWLYHMNKKAAEQSIPVAQAILNDAIALYEQGLQKK